MPATNASLIDTVAKIHLSYFRKNPGMIALLLLDLMGTPLQEVLIPHVFGNVINSLTQAKAGKEGDRKQVKAFVSLVVAVSFIKSVLWVSDWGDSIMMPSFKTFVRGLMLNCIMHKNRTSIGGKELLTGELGAQLIKTPQVFVSLLSLFKDITPHVFVFVFVVIYVGFVDKVMAGVIASSVVLMLTAVYYSFDRCSGITHQRDREANMVQEHMDDMMHNMPAIYNADSCGAEIDAMEPLSKSYETLFYRTNMCSTKIKAIMIPISIALVGIILYRFKVVRKGMRTKSKDGISIGKFIAILTMSVQTVFSMTWILDWSKGVVFSWGSIISSAEYIQGCDGDVGDKHRNSCLPEGAGAGSSVSGSVKIAPKLAGTDVVMRLDAVAMTARKLQPISFDVKRGDRIAIVGPIGSGKSTLLMIMAGVLTGDKAGHVWLNPDADGTVGYIPQRPTLFNRTVIHNIVYPDLLSTDLPTHMNPDSAAAIAVADAADAAAGGGGAAAGSSTMEQDVWEVAERLGLAPLLRSMPQGLGTIAGKNGSALSGGQRQAVWLMRMFMRTPRIEVLLMDEPTAAMDPESSAIVATAIRRFEATTIVVSHDMQLVKAIQATRTIDTGARGEK